MLIKFNELNAASVNEDEFSELRRDDSQAMSLVEIWNPWMSFIEV